MKVLILSVTAGQGHHAAAQAIKQEFESRGAMVEVMDILKYLGKPLYTTVDQGYRIGIQRIPRQFGHFYHALQKDSSVRSIISTITKTPLFSNKLYSCFRDGKPDVIITTHVLGALILDKMIQKKPFSVRHIGIVTDYTLHPFWEDVKNIEKLAVCGELILPRCRQRGLPSEILLPIGIPIEKRFTQSIPKERARQLLGVNTELPTALIMSGSMGFGNMAATVARIAGCGHDLQILCVCGRNIKQKIMLENSLHPVPVHVYGFAENIDVMLDASDFVVTKPGGLSSSEALSKGKGLILTAPIPGQEEENSDYLVNAGLAMQATKNMPVHELCMMVIEQPQLLENMRNAAKKFVPADPAGLLCDYIYNGYLPGE
ncbi:MAG: hypothetical protein FWH04_03045 [Oscillospiraceae bacterium]|nr:hypothetical protein [Oscillospiraceae bacterium]